MPLTRYQIRNEYGLADPELYKAADKDDPEALLEGVAMAGLVGVLRQLGDLAEFAAEVFHDLHEEVISTAARGHGLMIRVQQLEAEVPSIEKAFLSQTNHTSFFPSAGLHWRSNLQSEQSLVARGNLPRFVMDSYEECRGPPRLFLLDKFDVAGAGACLKRYTDPSVFKVEPTACERSTIQPQREKKIRKVKKKGPRWRNGGTPEIGPTTHAKLHDLFLEERIESCFNDPSRVVKLKKRQFNGRIDSKNGKSYMEKFLETPSPEHKMVYEASVAVPTLHSMSDNINELGIRILDITTVSPASKSPGRVSTCSSCIAQEEELKRPINGDVFDEEILKMPESTPDVEIETTSNLQMVVVENQLEYGEGKTGGSIDGYRSDEVISEVDNYVDALATMESEIETDNEPRSENVNIGNQRSESDANAEHLETPSFVNSSGSDDGNSSFKRERFSFSCSDTANSLLDNFQNDSEGAAKALRSISKACMVDIENISSNRDCTSHSHERNADELEVLDNTSVNEERISNSEAPHDSCFLDSISPPPLLNSESFPSSSLLVEPKLYETPSTNLVNLSPETDLSYHKDSHLDVPPEIISNHAIPSEGYHIRDREGLDVDATSENSLHLSNLLGEAVEIEAVEKVEDIMLQNKYQDDRTIDKQVSLEIESSPSSLIPSETSRASINDSSDDKHNVIVLKGDNYIVAAEAKYDDDDLPFAVEFSQTQDLMDDNIVVAEADFLWTRDLKDQVENIADDVLQVEDGLTETVVTYSMGDANILNITKAADDTSDELQLCYPNDTVHEMHLDSREFVAETVHPEGVTSPSPSVSSHDEVTSPGDLDHEDSIKYSNFVTGKVQADELVDSANCSDVVTEKVQADEVVNSVNGSEIVTEKVLTEEVVDLVNCCDVVTEKVQADKVLDFVNCSDVVTEKVQADEVVNSVNGSEIVTEKVIAEEVVDLVNCSDVVTEKVQADKVLDFVNCSDVVTEKVQPDEVVDFVICSNVTKKVRGDEVVDSVDCNDVATVKVQGDGVVVPNIATVPEVATKNVKHFSDEENESMDTLPTGTFRADEAFDADPTTRNYVNEVVSTSLNGLLSTSDNMKIDLLENHFENPYSNQNESDDASYYSVRPVIGNKVNHLEVDTAPLDSKDELISDYPASGIVDGIHNLPAHMQIQCTSVIDDLSFGPKSLELNNLESEFNSSHQGDLKEDIEVISPPPLCFSSAIETSNEPSPGLQVKHKEIELVQADVDVSNSSRLEQRSPGQLDEEKVELVQSSDPVQQDQSSEYKVSEETIQAGHYLSELYIQHPIGECNMTDRAMDTLQPVLPSYILLPEVPQVNLNEMPPLPPLPPMQWRLGKVQQAFPAPPRNEDPLQSVLPSKADEKGICLESSNAVTLQPDNPYSCFQDNKLTHIYGHMVHNTMQSSPFSLPMISNENIKYSSVTMEKQYNNPFLTLPIMPKESPEHDSLKSNGEKVQSDLKLPSLGPTNDDVKCKGDDESSYGQSFQPCSNSASETFLKPDVYHVSQDFEGELRNSHAMMAPLSFVKNEQSLVKNKQSQQDLPATEEEVATSSNTFFMPSTSGVGMTNGNPPTSSKLLRPRTPLIDAVAAHDKSKLRKVSDRILPEIGHKADERDSLLAQIRTKSFSLKPAVVTRPSVQGPKTNLRMAAILERANAIRQAFAGSDEDNDTDSWSDSE